MRFLFDECLSPKLALFAHERQIGADHVTWLGKDGTTDHGLMPLILEGDYIFVTNNAADFRRLYAKEEIHNGLVIILPNVRTDWQLELFEAFLDNYGAADLVNTAVEIAYEADEIIFLEYELPQGSKTVADHP
jgi:predicted nuclease of predicted toxin-antitoxin system